MNTLLTSVAPQKWQPCSMAEGFGMIPSPRYFDAHPEFFRLILSTRHSLYKTLQACAVAVRLDINNMLPVHRLPHEVLSQIFELACSPPSAATMAFRAALTHVCRYWRGVLLSYPKLWTNISARRDTSDFFSECLLRSRSLSVHLNLHYHVG